MHNNNKLIQVLSSKKLTTAIYCLWSILFIYILIRVSDNYFHPNTVSDVYYNAAKNWLNSKPLYSLSGGGFLYFPTSAVLMLPFCIFNIPIFNIIFRLIFILLFIYGISIFSKLFNNNTYKKAAFNIISITCIPLSIANLDLGQMHYLITAILLIAIYTIYTKKYWLSSFLLAISIALKPIFLPIYLISFAIFPRLRIKIIVWTLFFLILPFLTQAPNYVLNQYILCYKNLIISANLGITDKQSWPQIFNSLYTITGLDLSSSIQLFIRSIFAILCLITSYYLYKKKNLKQSLPQIFLLSLVYIALFNPRTENNDYIIIIPFIGYYLTKTIIHKNYKSAALIFIIYILICLNFSLSNLIIHDNKIWLKPIVSALFGIYILLMELYINNNPEKNKINK